MCKESLSKRIECHHIYIWITYSGDKRKQRPFSMFSSFASMTFQMKNDIFKKIQF